MLNIIETLQSKLTDLGLDQNIISDLVSHVDTTKIDLGNLPATYEYLGGLMQEFNFNENTINEVLGGLQSSAAENINQIGDSLGLGGIGNLSDLGNLFGQD